MNDKKDYIDEHDDWQTRQFLPGYFVGGRIPIWLKKPGNRKGFGAVLVLSGLFYGAYTIYNIYQIALGFQITERIFSVMFLSIPTFVFVIVGVKVFTKSRK